MKQGLVKGCGSSSARTQLGRPRASLAHDTVAVAGRPCGSRPQQEGRVMFEPVSGIGLPLAGWPRKQFLSVPYPLPCDGPASSARVGSMATLPLRTR
jgi:hypothetical protein